MSGIDDILGFGGTAVAEPPSVRASGIDDILDAPITPAQNRRSKGGIREQVVIWTGDQSWYDRPLTMVKAKYDEVSARLHANDAEREIGENWANTYDTALGAARGISQAGTFGLTGLGEAAAGQDFRPETPAGRTAESVAGFVTGAVPMMAGGAVAEAPSLLWTAGIGAAWGAGGAIAPQAESYVRGEQTLPQAALGTLENAGFGAALGTGLHLAGQGIGYAAQRANQWDLSRNPVPEPRVVPDIEFQSPPTLNVETPHEPPPELPVVPAGTKVQPEPSPSGIDDILGITPAETKPPAAVAGEQPLTQGEPSGQTQTEGQGQRQANVLMPTAEETAPAPVNTGRGNITEAEPTSAALSDQDLSYREFEANAQRVLDNPRKANSVAVYKAANWLEENIQHQQRKAQRGEPYNADALSGWEAERDHLRAILRERGELGAFKPESIAREQAEQARRERKPEPFGLPSRRPPVRQVTELDAQAANTQGETNAGTISQAARVGEQPGGPEGARSGGRQGVEQRLEGPQAPGARGSAEEATQEVVGQPNGERLARATELASKADPNNMGALMGSIVHAHKAGLSGEEAINAAWSLYAAQSDNAAIKTFGKFKVAARPIEAELRPQTESPASTPRPEAAQEAGMELRRDVTKKLVSEATSSILESAKKVQGFKKKSPDAPMSQTEQHVYDRMSDGLQLGFTSNALVYDDAVRHMSVVEKKAMLSLLDRGKLRVVETENPRGYRIESSTPPPAENAGTGQGMLGGGSWIEGEMRKLKPEQPKPPEPATAAARTITLPDGRVFPEHNGEPLNWAIGSYMNAAEAKAGYPKALAVLRAMKEHRPQEFQNEYRDMLRGSFDRTFGQNAKKALSLIEKVRDEPTIHPEEPPTLELHAGLTPKSVIDSAKRLAQTNPAKGARNIGSRILNTVAAQLRRTGPVGEKLAEGLDKSWNLRGEIYGESHVAIEDALAAIKKKSGAIGVRKAKADWARALMEHQNGRPYPSDLTPEGRQLLAAWGKEYARLGELAQANKLMFHDPKTGEWRPIQLIGEKGFPRIIKPEMLEQLRDPSSTAYKEAEAFLLKEGMTRAEVAKALDIIPQYKTNVYERVRGPKLPDNFYESSFDKIAQNYLLSISRDIADVKVFGQFTRDLKPLLDQVNGAGRYRAGKIMEAYFHPEPREEGTNWSSVLGSFEATTKIGLNPLSIIKNATQTLTNTIPTFGVKNVVKAQLRRAEGLRLFKLSGSDSERFLRGFAGASDEIDRLGLISRAATKAFSIVERDNRVVAGMSANLWAEDAAAALKKGVSPRVEARIRRTLEDRLHLDADAIKARGTLTESERLQAVREGIRHTQFSTEFQDLPLWANHQHASVIRQFKTFAYHQARFFNNQILGEAKKGNLKPLGAFLIGMGLSGEGINKLRTTIYGERDRDIAKRERRVDDLTELLGNETIARGLERAWSDIAFSGALGLAGDTAETISDKGRTMWDSIEPVVVKSGERLVRAALILADRDMETEQKQTKLLKLLGQEIVPLGQTMGFSAQHEVGPEWLQEAGR